MAEERQQAAEDAALQTAIMLSLADAGHEAAASAIGISAPEGMSKRRQTPECASCSQCNFGHRGGQYAVQVPRCAVTRCAGHKFEERFVFSEFQFQSLILYRQQFRPLRRELEQALLEKALALSLEQHSAPEVITASVLDNGDSLQPSHSDEMDR